MYESLTPEAVKWLLSLCGVIVMWLARNLWVRQSALEAEFAKHQQHVERIRRELDDRSQLRHDTLRNLIEKHHNEITRMMLTKQGLNGD